MWKKNICLFTGHVQCMYSTYKIDRRKVSDEDPSITIKKQNKAW
jgi:hypothetical protein